MGVERVRDEAVAARAKQKLRERFVLYKKGHWPHCQRFENGTESEGLLHSDFYYILRIR